MFRFRYNANYPEQNEKSYSPKKGEAEQNGLYHTKCVEEQRAKQVRRP